MNAIDALEKIIDTGISMEDVHNIAIVYKKPVTEQGHDIVSVVCEFPERVNYHKSSESADRPIDK